jgi:HD-like signal output (HDOD) protein
MTVDILELPPPSPVLAVLLGRIEDPRHSLRDLTEVIRMDPALSAAVLQVSNSVMYARPGSSVSTIDEAVMRIGENDVVRIVVGKMSSWLGQADTDGYGLAREKLWRRALLCAIAADEIARRTDQSPGIAFTTGLLLDIGKIALGRRLAAHADAVRARLEDRPDDDFAAVEADVVGDDHAAVGARLAEGWNFPPAIVQAIRFHHRPTAAPRLVGLTALAHVADIISLQCGAPVGMDDLRYTLEEDAVAALALSDQMLDLVCAAVSARYQREKALFED